MAFKILLRRGLEAARTGITPDEGEPIFSTDEQKFYIGDGSTAGGILVGDSGFFATIFVDGSSDVGIGTATPDAKLHVFTGDTTVVPDTDADDFMIECAGDGGMTIATPATAKGIINFGDPSDSDAGHIEYDHNTNDMIFGTNGAEVVRINDTGEVGIGGTADSGSTLHVQSSELDFRVTGTVVQIERTQEDSNGPELQLIHDSTTPSGTDTIGNLVFNGRDDAAGLLSYAVINVLSTVVTNTNESGQIKLSVMSDGTLQEALNIAGSSKEITFSHINTDAIGWTLELEHDSSGPTDDDVLGRIRARGRDTGGNLTSYADIDFVAEDTADASEDARIEFKTTDNGGAVLPRMVINTTGVGIGTTSPDVELHVFQGDASASFFAASAIAVEGSGSTFIQIVTGDAGTSGLYLGHTSDTNDVGGGILLQSDNELQLLAGGVVKQRITSTGLVAMGTSPPTTPLANLHIERADGTVTSVRLENIGDLANDDIGSIQFFALNDASVQEVTQYAEILACIESPSNGSEDGRIDFQVMSSGTLTNKMTIIGSGSVGIGTLAPASPLEVAGVIHSTSGGIKFPDNTTQTTAAVAGGDVSKVGTPANGQVGVWTGDGTIEGTNDFIFDNAGDGTIAVLELSTTAPGNNGPLFRVNHNSISPAANDFVLRLEANGKDDAAATVAYGTMSVQVADPATSDAWGKLLLTTRQRSVTATALDFDPQSGDFAFVTNRNATTGANLILRHQRAVPADEDIVGSVTFEGFDSGLGEQDYGQINVYAEDVVATGEDGRMEFELASNGTLNPKMILDRTSGLGIGSAPDPQLGPGALTLSSTGASGIILTKTNEALNEKRWIFFLTGGALIGRAYNDTGSGGEQWLNVSRTAAAIDTISFPNGNVTIGGGAVGTNDEGLTLSTNLGTGGVIEIRSTASTINDNLGIFSWFGKDGSSNDIEYARMQSIIVDSDSISEDARIDFQVMSEGTLTTKMTVAPTSVGVGTTTPGSTLSVSGGMSIGAPYATTAGLDNGLIVSDRIGIGTTSPTSTAKLSIHNPNTSQTEFRIENEALATGAVGGIEFHAQDEDTNDQEYANIVTRIVSSTAGTEKGAIDFGVAFFATPNVRMTISGDAVGINETDPQEYLHIRRVGFGDTVQNTALFTTESTSDRGDGFGAGISFAIEDDTSGLETIAQISAVRDGADDSGAIYLSPYSGGSIDSGALTVASGGDVGIGTTAPDNLLHVFGGEAGTATWQNETLVAIEGDDTSYLQMIVPAGDTVGFILGHVDDSIDIGGRILLTSTNEIDIYANGSNPTLSVTNTGLGIGNVVPTGNYQLHVNRASTSNVQMQLSNQRKTAGKFSSIDFIALDDIDVAQLYGTITCTIVDPLNTNPDGRLDFAASTNGLNNPVLSLANNFVGVNEQDPQKNLHVRGSNTATSTVFVIARFLAHNAIAEIIDGYGPAIEFAIEDDTSGELVTGRISTERDGADNSGAIHISSYNAGSINTDALVVAADANVGIGTSSPDSLLEVAGQIHSTSTGFKFPDDSVQSTAAVGTGSSVAVTTWTEVTGTSQTIVSRNGYTANNAGLVTFTLPATAAIGETIEIVGLGAGLYAIAQLASQTIHFGNTDTTTGVGGSLTATNRYDSISLRCVIANLDWVVLGSQGSFTIV